MFVVDLMHEFELGVWKAVFMHWIHLLTEVGPAKVQELNQWFLHIPTFGCHTIWWFCNKCFWNETTSCSRLWRHTPGQFQLPFNSPWNGRLIGLSAVCNAYIWRVVPQSSWHHYPTPFIHACFLAFLGQATHAYRHHTHTARLLDDTTRACLSFLCFSHMQSLDNTWTPPRDSSWSPTSGQSSSHSAYTILNSPPYLLHMLQNDVQPDHTKAAFPWELCFNNQIFQYHRCLFHPNSMHILCCYHEPLLI